MINIQSSNPLLKNKLLKNNKLGAEKKSNSGTYVNAATLYKQNDVNTASPAELTMMLYDGAVKFCSMAITALDKGNLEECNKNIIKIKNIITEFRMTLDFQYEVSKDFDRVYDYIYWVLTQANVKKDKDLLEEALKQIRGMRDTWREVMKAAKGNQENKKESQEEQKS